MSLNRIIVGFSILFIALGVLHLGGLVMTVAMLVFSWIASTEYINIVRLKGINPSNRWIRFVSLSFIVTASLPLFGLSLDKTLKLYMFSFIFGVIGSFFRLVCRSESKGESIATIGDISTSVLGFVYTGILPSFFILIRFLGYSYALTLCISTAICDVGAYYGGKLFGRHKLKPEISPRKTIEGALCGLSSSIIVALLYVYIYREDFNNNIMHGIPIGLIAGLFSQFGDFFESLLKRDAGVKDSGDIFQSHGGVLDRSDGFLFVIWAEFFYIYWVVLGKF